MEPRTACAIGAVAATAASVGDGLLLWFASGGRSDLPALPPLSADALLAGHYLGVVAIPLYGVGYWGVAQALRPADAAAARWVLLTGAAGGAYGGAVHGITAIAELAGRATALGRALLVPAAPNVAHAAFFALAALALSPRTRGPSA